MASKKSSVPKQIYPNVTTAAREARKVKRSTWEGEEVPNTHKAFTDQDFEDFITFCHSDDDKWIQALKKPNLLVWRRELSKEEKANSDIKCIRVRATFEGFEAEKLYDLMHNHEYRKTWDENMLDGYPVRIINKTHEVGYYAAKTPTGMNQRDFCNKRGWRRFPKRNMWMIMNESVRDHGCPEYKDFIRAWSYRTGTLLKKLDDGKIEIIYTTRSDPRGWIPAWLVNSIATKFVPKFLDKLFKAYEKYDAWEAAQGEDYYKFWLDDEGDASESWTLKQAKKKKFRQDKMYRWSGAAKVSEKSKSDKSESKKADSSKQSRKADSGKETKKSTKDKADSGKEPKKSSKDKANGKAKAEM